MLAQGVNADALTMLDCPDMLRHFAHLNSVRGGALLASSQIGPVLTWEEWRGESVERTVRQGTWTTTGHMRVGRKTMPSRTTWAEGATGIRQLKDMWGVPHRPVRR